jgi:peptidoglycan/LPS O-acetylase OafA/YrhL
VLFKHGILGVYFFFIISGFVIFMTLEKCRNIGDFAKRRLMRLWPTLLLCSLITYAGCWVLDPNGAYAFFQNRPENFLPSLTFTRPHFWEGILNITPLHWIDGAYWSLVCEASFYVTASMLFFTGRKRFLKSWLLFSTPLVLFYCLTNNVHSASIVQVRDMLSVTVFPQYLIFFTLGIYFYMLYCNKSIRRVEHVTIIGTFLIHLILTEKAIGDFAFILAFVALFIIFVFRPKWLSFLSLRFFQFTGLISYPLYLLHQNLGVLATIKLSQITGSTSIFVTFVPAILAIYLLATLVNKYYERRVPAFFKALSRRKRQLPASETPAVQQLPLP